MAEVSRDRPYSRIIYLHPDELNKLWDIFNHIPRKKFITGCSHKSPTQVVVNAKLKQEELLLIALSVKTIKIDRYRKSK